MRRSPFLNSVALGAALLGLAAGGATTWAEARDPAYAAARAAGQVGEKMDGYLGMVGAGGASLRAMVDDLNIKRRAVYSQKAQAQHATVEEYAMAQACILIWRTVPGERYQAPDGSWRTRTEAPPLRDPRCP